MFTIKIYKYDSTKDGYRGEDFSRFLSQGQDVTEDITQILDTSEITLFGLTTKTAFEPETKFIVDILENGTIVETIHRCVSRDIVNQPVLSDETYFDHHISMIEPSVVAQKRLVDNIASTYKLKDVSLQEVPAFPDTTATYDFVQKNFTPAKKFGTFSEVIEDTVTHKITRFYNVSGKKFGRSGTPKVLNDKDEEFTTIYNNIDKFKNDDGTYSARFVIPKVQIYCGADNSTTTWGGVGYASLDYSIKEYTLNDTLKRQWSGTIISNSELKGYGVTIPTRDIKGGEWVLESLEKSIDISGALQQDLYYKKYTDTSAPAPSYITQKIDIKNPLSNSKVGRVILQPINLVKVASMLRDDKRGLAKYIEKSVL